MSEKWLTYQTRRFLPKEVQGRLLNIGMVFSDEEMDHIKQAAFPNQWLLQQSSGLILPKMFQSGMCTGMSAWALLRFIGATDGLDERHHCAVLQARILRSILWRQVVADYMHPSEKIMQRLAVAIEQEEAEEFPLLLLIPQVNNMICLPQAHTVVPYRFLQQGNLCRVWVYDCNAPGDDQKVLKWDVLSGCWKYETFHSGKWFMALTPLKTLL